MKIGDRDRRRILEYYRDSFGKFGPSDARSLHWASDFNQRRRFDMLIGVGIEQGSSVLDVGCGLGDLYGYMLEGGLETRYTGIDIVPEFVAEARSRFPGANFVESDAADASGTYDYVLASGAMSFKVDNNDEFYRTMVRRLYLMADKALAFNMLDRSTHQDDETYASYDPAETADYCRSISGRVETLIGYMQNDFTIYMYK